MSFNLLSASLSMFWYSVFFTRKSSVTFKASAILAAVSMEGLISSRSYFPMISPEVPTSLPRSAWVIDAAWQQIDGGEQPVGNGTKLPHDYMSAELTAREPGFAYVYFSNESATLVDGYFDAVTMTYTPGNILQYNEYYPFGLNTANSWTRENVTTNNFLGNGGTELNAISSVYDLHYRNYDPVLGRMNQIDPMATKYASLSPYSYSNNDPVFFNDPLGDDYISTWLYNLAMHVFNSSSYEGPAVDYNGNSGWGANDYGGSASWTLGGGWSPLTNGQALEAGINYNNYFNSWGHTAFGSSVYSSTEFGGGTFMFDYNGGNYGVPITQKMGRLCPLL